MMLYLCDGAKNLKTDAIVVKERITKKRRRDLWFSRKLIEQVEVTCYRVERCDLSDTMREILEKKEGREGDSSTPQ